ncbi:uncharacterized protein LOC128724977 [Anopheles nili]|uniref:uncharacterized protein LOC128724977 n=1 Tax=Anopheles nili TaxID=185578 RepID=UPI00237A1BEF|nr:uncharacterized protein LOC128724977 [Anopheles nili]
MSNPRWIHCNVCFHLFAKKGRKFYHLSCRHVLCKPCMAKTDRGTTCPVCRKPLERYTELSNQMDRKEKMCYDPAIFRVYNVTYHSILFQYKHREHMIGGILRCRKALAQLKEMENSLRQQIVETQRRYEKCRTYRRNLQENLRQISPRFSDRPRNNNSDLLALSNRTDDQTSRSDQRPSSCPFNFSNPIFTHRPPTVPVPPEHHMAASDLNDLANSSSLMSYCSRTEQHPSSRASSFCTPAYASRPATVSVNSTGQHVTVTNRYSQRSSVGSIQWEGNTRMPSKGCGVSDDSGISDMQTPGSCLSYGNATGLDSHPQQQHVMPYPSTPVRQNAFSSYFHRAPSPLLMPGRRF